MGISAATLNGHRVTAARVNLPAWGCWYADASVDGDVTLTGAVELKINDLTLKGTILSGGPHKGKSEFRIVAGAGQWGKELPKKSYVDDAGVKVTKIVGDAAREAGETFESSSSDRVGAAWARQDGPASAALEQIAPNAWYVGEDGVTRLGARTGGTLPTSVTHGPVDLARGTVTLASESIAAILPGLVVDGLTAVDVCHEISTKGGLRSTVWGAQGGTSRRLTALRKLVDRLDPDRAFRGLTEYRVVTLSGERLNLQPVRVSTGMPDLDRVLARPGVPGCYGAAALGSRVLVGFVDGNPARPFVVGFEDAEGEGFQPTALSLLAGGMAGGEHVMTTEATVLLVYNVLVALMTAAGGGPLLAAVLQPLIVPAIIAAASAQGAPAPPTAVAQAILNATLGGTMAAGTTPSNALGPLSAATALLSTKTSNDSGFFPSVGSKAVEVG